ncbi:MAG TPA: lysine 2,3-aminomutase, partial [Desulfobacteria bacterium]|nr:lysine 2,3-aminomutase [Desulfobacteria bacterium]
MAVQGTILYKQQQAEVRAKELRQRIADFLEQEPLIPTGFRLQDQLNERKERIKTILGATEEQWRDWRWQLNQRINQVSTLAKILGVPVNKLQEIDVVGKSFRWALSPYYASLMDPTDPNCPIRRMSLPSLYEIDDHFGEDDPMGEEFTSP